jgi:predicted P-loop ATPase
MTDNVHPFPQIDVWLERVLRGDRGVILSNFANAMTVLKWHPGIRDALIFDNFAKKALLTHPINEPLNSYPEPRDITDQIVNEVQSWMQHLGMRSMSADNVGRALVTVAHDHSFHPVLNYLEPLIWDGTDRNSRWLSSYLGATDNEYSRLVGPLFLISMIARVFEPGVKVDYMLVFEHRQGRLKSMACEVLFAPWFSDGLPDISHNKKDASMHLRGRWGLEISEMQSFNRAETTDLKDFITRKTERYRPPYGRLEVDEPRQCVFIGTTNKDTYLKDETGARRFWPVKCGSIKIEELTEARDQMLAQAVFDYHRGICWWPAFEAEQQHIVKEQAARYDSDDAWAEPIRRLLQDAAEVSFSDVLDTLEYNANKHTKVDQHGNEVRDPNYTPINRIGKFEQNRVKAILVSEGWERSERRDARGRSLWRPRS